MLMKDLLENDLFSQFDLSNDGMGTQVRGWFSPAQEIFRQELVAHFWEVSLSEIDISKHWTKVTNTIHSSCKTV